MRQLFRRHSKQRRGRTNRDQRGSILVELALVITPLMFISMGMIEMGIAWRDSLSLDQATRAAARVAANASNEPHADQEALRSLLATLEEDDLDNVNYVIVFNPNASGEIPDPNCHTGGVTGVCNHYSPADLALVAGPDWDCSDPGLDGSWCPTTRNPEFHSPVDLGVHIEGRRDWVTGFLPGDGIDLRSTTIMRLNPLHR